MISKSAHVVYFESSSTSSPLGRVPTHCRTHGGRQWRRVQSRAHDQKILIVSPGPQTLKTLDFFASFSRKLNHMTFFAIVSQGSHFFSLKQTYLFHYGLTFTPKADAPQNEIMTMSHASCEPFITTVYNARSRATKGQRCSASMGRQRGGVRAISRWWRVAHALLPIPRQWTVRIRSWRWD